jgi:hypothetical protein
VRTVEQALLAGKQGTYNCYVQTPANGEGISSHL